MSDPKPGIGRVWPDNATASGWGRVEPLVTPQQMRTRHLFGLPLVSETVDPITGRKQVYTDDMLRDTIDRAIAIAESELHIDIMPVKRRDKLPFDRATMEMFGYMTLPHRPVSIIEKMSITPPDGNDIYNMPLEWLEMSYARRGQINLIPIGSAVAYTSVMGSFSQAGALFLNVLNNWHWVPAFWQVEYVTGYPDGQLPKIVNEFVGVVAAMEALSLLGATNARNAGHSLGIDGLSQSISSPGGQLFRPRYEDLAQKRDSMKRQLKTFYAGTIVSSNI